MEKIKLIAKELMARFSEHNIGPTGGMLAYFFLLSIFPFLIFLNALMGFLNLPIDQIMSELYQIVPNEVVSLLEGYIDSVVMERSTSLLSIGLLAALFSASKAVDSLIFALNTAYNVQNKRSFIKKKSISIFFTFLLGLSIAITLIIPPLGKDMMMPIVEFFGVSDFFITLWIYVRWIIVFSILFITIALLYVIVPYNNLGFKRAIPGTVFSTLGWILVSYGFAIYVNNFGNYSAIYGSLGAIIILMMWLYISGIILIIGGELNHILYTLSNSKDEADENPKDSIDTKFEKLKEDLEVN